MRTHHIQVMAMLNPAGAVFATLDINVSNQKDFIEFGHPDSLRANYAAEFVAAFEEMFVETFKLKSKLRDGA